MSRRRIILFSILFVIAFLSFAKFMREYTSITTWDKDPAADAEQFARTYPLVGDKLELIQTIVEEGDRGRTYVFLDRTNKSTTAVTMTRFLNGWQRKWYSRLPDYLGKLQKLNGPGPSPLKHIVEWK